MGMERSKLNAVKVAVWALNKGLSRLAEIAPSEMTVLTEDGDWAALGEDFKDAIDSIIASDASLQRLLPFDDEDVLDEAK